MNNAASGWLSNLLLKIQAKNSKKRASPLEKLSEKDCKTDRAGKIWMDGSAILNPDDYLYFEGSDDIVYSRETLPPFYRSWLIVPENAASVLKIPDKSYALNIGLPCQSQSSPTFSAFPKTRTSPSSNGNSETKFYPHNLAADVYKATVDDIEIEWKQPVRDRLSKGGYFKGCH